MINFELKKLFTYRKKSSSAPATGPDTGCDDLELETSSEQLDDFRGSASGDREPPAKKKKEPSAKVHYQKLFKKI